jgi:hypothetical protein
MNGYTPDVPASDFDFAGMKARAQRQSDLLRDRFERQCTPDSAARSIESRQMPSPVDLIRVPRCLSTN